MSHFMNQRRCTYTSTYINNFDLKILWGAEEGLISIPNQKFCWENAWGSQKTIARLSLRLHCRHCSLEICIYITVLWNARSGPQNSPAPIPTDLKFRCHQKINTLCLKKFCRVLFEKFHFYNFPLECLLFGSDK